MRPLALSSLLGDSQAGRPRSPSSEMRGLAALSTLSAATFFVVLPLFSSWILRRRRRDDGAAAAKHAPADPEADAVVVDISGWRV
eukprot:1198976-Prymnesium_polylepis.1